jgi:hypothetical protein
MQTRFLISVLLVTFLINACTPALPPEQGAPTASVSQPEPVEPTLEPPQEPDPLPTSEAGLVVETVAPDCLGDEISPIGEAIANEYELASYDQVMTWFCNGAEFEDILAALETESQTGTPAEEMLQMLADGFTWDEIWQITGLTD